jgi:DHA1 family multidrug resistance protein-like MFS transporter
MLDVIIVLNYLRELALLPRGVKQFLMSEPFLGMAFGLYALLFNLHLLAHHITEIEIGKIIAIGSIVMALFAIPFGMIADRIGRKKVLVSGLCFITLSHYLIAFGSSFYHFMLAQIILSFGMSMMISAETPLLFKYCKTKKEETQTYNMMFAVFTLFVGAGTLIGGYLPQIFDATRADYQGTMTFMAISITIVTIARFFLPDEEHVKKEKDDKRFQFHIKQAFPSKKVFIYVGFSVFAGASFSFLMPFLNIIVKFRLDWSDPMVAILLTANGFCLFLASFFTPYLLEIWGLRRLSFLLFFFTISTSLLLFLVLPLSIFILFFLFRNGTFTALFNLIEGQSMQATEDEERSLHASYRSIGKSLGTTLAAYAAGFILAAENYWLPFLLSGIIIAFAYFYYRYLMLERLEEDLKEDI